MNSSDFLQLSSLQHFYRKAVDLCNPFMRWMKLSELIPNLYKKRHPGSIAAAGLSTEFLRKLKNTRKLLWFSCLRNVF